MKKFLLIIFCITLLSSCGNSAYVDACKEIIKEQLKDPYSVQWESVEEISAPGATFPSFKITYNAKNSYGAYAGKSEYYCEEGIEKDGVIKFYYTGEIKNKDRLDKVWESSEERRKTPK